MSIEHDLQTYYDNEAAAGARAAMGSRGRRDDLRAAFVDLAVGNSQLAQQAGLRVVPGSLSAPPFRRGVFDAGWTMSTLLHVPNLRFDAAMEATVSLLQPGSPLAIGLWGGIDREFTNDTDHFDPPRFFSLRSDERVQAMLAPFGEIESFESWPNVRSDWSYQFIVLRTLEARAG